MDNSIFGEVAIEVISEQGREILNMKSEKTSMYFSTDIDLRGQSKGFYIMKMLVAKYDATIKLIVE